MRRMTSAGAGKRDDGTSCTHAWRPAPAAPVLGHWRWSARHREGTRRHWAWPYRGWSLLGPRPWPGARTSSRSASRPAGFFPGMYGHRSVTSAVVRAQMCRAGSLPVASESQWAASRRGKVPSIWQGPATGPRGAPPTGALRAMTRRYDSDGAATRARTGTDHRSSPPASRVVWSVVGTFQRPDQQLDIITAGGAAKAARCPPAPQCQNPARGCSRQRDVHQPRTLKTWR